MTVKTQDNVLGKHLLMELTVNGRPVSTHVKAGRRLIDFLRDDLLLYGTKEGCGEGECGSCTVLLNGTAILSCLVPMERVNGGEIRTIEGAGTPAKLHPLQQAMIEEGGVQCGMCTPGMIMSGIDLLNRNPQPTREEIIEGIAGNLCRCTGYQKIITAIERAAQKLAADQR
jgi:carbon-monoxide dehydrogenase small subunit